VLVRRARGLLAALLLIGCRDTSAPDITMVGAHCASTTPRVVRSGNGAVVTLFENETRLEEVRLPSGEFVVQEFRSCLQHECVYEQLDGATDQQLIDRCRDAVG
jgi:hypothetical protein